ncbi:MAG: hypothetical protein LBU67_07990 [Oscillospiraceae bacterium]|jgi:hypothetical protein|nr:hypothetical protein [Oscillospiraceae bacterium]
MRRFSLPPPLFAAVLCLFAFSVSAQAYVPAEGPGEIDSIVLTITPSFGLIDELTENLAIIRPNEGTVLMQTLRKQDDAVQKEKLFLTHVEDVDTLVASLYEQDFFNMPEYLETGVMDGDFTWITVNMKNGESKRAGGLVAKEYGPKGFIALCDAINQVLQNSAEYPNGPADEHAPLGDGQRGTPLFAFCGAEDIAARIAADPPSCVSVCLYTIAGGPPYVTEDAAAVRRVIDALAGMTVLEPSGTGHTDDYLVYTAEWTDGTKFTVTFQTGMLLDEKDRLYSVSGFDALMQALPPMIAPS